MHYFVTGGAGFIGSNLTDRLLMLGHKVTVYDNLTTGFQEFLATASKDRNFHFIEGDILNQTALIEAMSGTDFVFHLAANADVRYGTRHPGRDLEQNTIATANVLEAMRFNKIMKIAFASTGSIYGDAKVIPTPEDAPFPIQTSLYGASKLAAEGLIAAYCAGFGYQSWIYRFVSVLGPRYTHGHVFDFLKQLMANPTKLKILGDGNQRKSYMHVNDCIDGILLGIETTKENVNTINLGFDGYCTVRQSIGWICERLGVHPVLEFTGGNRGWIGDSPFIYLDVKRVYSLGWKPKFEIADGVTSTVDYLRDNGWIFERRT